MKFTKSLKLSIKALAVNKLRTALALSGISVGVAAMIIMVAMGQGAKQETLDRIESMGVNMLTIKAKRVKKQVGRTKQFDDYTSLRIRDAQAISKEISLVAAAIPVQDRTLRVKYGNFSGRTRVMGTSPEFLTVRNYALAQGRFFSKEENKAGLRIAVIGNHVRQNLFPDTDPVGETIRIGKVPFEVVGIMKSKGVSAEGANEDDIILIPIHAAMRRVFNINHLKMIFVQVKERAFMVQAQEEISELLRERHRLNIRQKADDFTIQNQVTALEVEEASGNAFNILIIGIGGIALFVGGIGILAIMLVSVRERTNEIGLRMAIGARPGDILMQFLLEALLIGKAGGITGLVTGLCGIWIIRLATAIPASIPPGVIGASILFSICTGLFFGVYPAHKASRMDPVEALRAE